MENLSEEFSVELQGGSPWGFALQGGLDHRSPLRIGKVTAGGRAASGGLVAGDYILSINGQSTKELKHLQAQQIIKRSKNSVLLHCTKVRPGLMSPAVTSTAPASFSFPVANSNKTPPTKAKALSVLRPKPPPGPAQQVLNGHTHHGSQDTPSESTTTSVSSPSSLASPSNAGPSPSLEAVTNTEMYNVKFEGMQYVQEAASDCACKGVSPLATPTNDVIKDDQDSGNVSPDQPDNVSDSADQSDNSQLPLTQEMEPTIAEEQEEEELNEEVEDVSAMVEDIQKEVEDLKEVVTSGDDGLEGSSNVFSGSGHSKEPSTEGSGFSKEGSPSEEGRGRRRSQRNSFSKRELADVITQAAQTRIRRESSADLSSSMHSDEGLGLTDPPPKQASVATDDHTPSTPADHTPSAPADHTPPHEEEEEEVLIIKPTLSKKQESTPVLSREPGWYQQMFQSFSDTVQEAFPGAKPKDAADVDATPTYEYDERGLKVESGSVQRKVEESKPQRKELSPEPVVYVYDERGLRVPLKKAGKHIRGKSTPAVMIPDEVEPPGKFSASDGATKDDILAANKRTTYIKTRQYSTDNSRDYWQQKDKEHIEFDEQRRRRSVDIITQRRHSSSSASDYTEKMTHMHPLLRPDIEDDSDKQAAPEEHTKVFDRIDASKLQGALANASTLTTLEHEGVPSHLLPAIAQSQQEAAATAAREEEKKKALKPPPGPKAQAGFNFQGKNEKELSFSKGDFINLTHTIDENWLEGAIGDKAGIFPANYVKVLTQAEYEALVAPSPPSPVTKALALFDFEGQTQRELGFQKGDVLTIDKKVDDNWFSGTLGDDKGIFPAAYVKIVEQ